MQDELELRLAVRERGVQAAAVANLRSGVLVTDPNLPDNPIIFANPGFLALTGYDYGEVIGRNCRFLQGAHSDPGTVAAIHAAVAERRPFHGELLNYRRDGTPFWNELTITPVLGADGRLLNFVGLQTDVTERKRTADQLQESFDRLRALERQRDNLTDMIIHDLRSPLTVVLGNLELLAMDPVPALGSEELDMIAQAREGARALQRMITSLLDVSRLEAGEMPMELRPVDLRNVVAAATDPLIPLVAPRSCGRDLPPVPVRVVCDAQIIQRVIGNLVTNAIKFTPHDGRIDIAVTLAPGRARVSVRDTGQGIPVEFRSRVFEKFGQVESRKHRHSTGLGLTFCKLAVEAHGGSIGVDTAVGTGSTFWFELRRADEVGPAS